MNIKPKNNNYKLSAGNHKLIILVLSIVTSIIIACGNLNYNTMNDTGAIGVLVRYAYTALGILDTSFNSTGVAASHGACGGDTSDYAKDIAIDNQGRIVVTGYSDNDPGAGNNFDMVIWRYNDDGTLDTTFNSTGIVCHNSAAGGNGIDRGNSIAIDSKGRIVVAGTSAGGTFDMAIWRYNSDGTLDDTFSDDGYLVHDNSGNDAGNSVAVDSQNRIVVVGYTTPTNANMMVWRYNENGTPDTSFAGSGRVQSDSAANGNGVDGAEDVVIDSQGRILIAGYSDSDPGAGINYDMVVWCLNDNGLYDTTFNTDHSETEDTSDENGILCHGNGAGGSGADAGLSLTLDSVGRILVTGYSANGSGNFDMAIWRYNPDGTLDSTFNTDHSESDDNSTLNGVLCHDNAAGGSGADAGNSILIDPFGRIVVAGNSRNGSGNDDMAVWVYNSDGTLSSGFNTDHSEANDTSTQNGVLCHHNAAAGNGTDIGQAIAVDFFGRFVIGGVSDGTGDDMAIWRYK